MQYEAMFQTLDGVVDVHTQYKKYWLDAMRKTDINVDDLRFLLNVIKPYKHAVKSLTYINGLLAIIPKEDAKISEINDIISIIVYNPELIFDAKIDYALEFGTYIKLEY